MMWVLRKKKDEKGDLLKYKARAVVCGNQQKRKALISGAEHTLETFAPVARSATFKLLCAVGCAGNLRVRQFDVEAAYLQGTFEGDDGEVGPYQFYVMSNRYLRGFTKSKAMT
eukprot:3155597-Pleurochrysis_carterae.AAC.1